MKKRAGKIVIMLIVSIGVIALGQLACNSDQELQNVPSLESIEKGNPKLDSQLNQLVNAERRGEAVAFTEQRNIELVDSKVRVIIECVPGQLQAVSEAATNAGAALESSYDNLLQAIVPINRLNTLADEPGIHFIRLPQYALPGGDK